LKKQNLKNEKKVTDKKRQILYINRTRETQLHDIYLKIFTVKPFTINISSFGAKKFEKMHHSFRVQKRTNGVIRK
jgi:hypothetical protein